MLKEAFCCTEACVLGWQGLLSTGVPMCGGDVCVGVGVSVCACVRGCVSACVHIHALAFVTLFSAIAEFTGCKCCG